MPSWPCCPGPDILAMEQAGRVNGLLLGFLDGPAFEAGLRNRKAVLGAAHVERSLANAGAFAGPWQDFITRMAWGKIWGDTTMVNLVPRES